MRDPGRVHRSRAMPVTATASPVGRCDAARIDRVLEHNQRRLGLSQAVAALHDWSKKGYFTAKFGGVAGQAFVDGKALFHFDYSGSLPLKAGQSSRFGSFILPRNDGRPAVATMSSATNFSVAAKSKHAAAAAAFLNFAASPAAAQIAADLGTDPMLAPKVTTKGSDPLFADEVANASAIAAHDSSVPYLDWATPTLLTTIEVKMQGLFAGRANVAAVSSAANADDVKFKQTPAK